MLTHSRPLRLALAISLACSAASVGAATPSDLTRLPDHYEFDASLYARFQADAAGTHPIQLRFDYPAGGGMTNATWQVDVVSPRGQVVRRWIGQSPLRDGRGEYRFAWDGRGEHGVALPEGFYSVRLRAVPAIAPASERGLPLQQRARRSFALGRDELVDQRMDVRVGKVAAPRMPRFDALPHGAHAAGKGKVAAQSTPAGSLPYTIFYGNLHSQTNHSDGGTVVTSCGGAETPQAGTQGPSEAYAMMQTQAGGDFLLTSEHNHMYDGSTGTNTAATPAQANNLFSSGLSLAAAYRSAHPDFLALYGNEWGVISNGGHMNVFNPDVLATWEYNASNQLLGGVATPKSDYAAMYAVMKQRGWIGQFNHPASSGQFQINGTALAYDANGRDVMVAAEVRNTSAFSTNTTQSETGGGTYTTAFNILLERGYHVAPTSDQDNHCANWGIAGKNRTGVLLPTGAALTVANFLDAMKARRAFATEDKTAQVVLTGNGQVMGQSMANSGALTLAANYASSSGGTAARVQFFEGVPGRNGTVTQLFEGAGTTTFTPAAGEHFYYVQVTEADGDRLWSAPLWVTQGAGGGDTTPPSVSASEAGTAGTITLSATASDDVGVANVEFFVDGISRGSDTTSPYSMTLDSTTLANGSHSLTARASDAAGNATTSTAVAFSVSNPVSDTTAPTVTASESGTAGTITLSATANDNVGVAKVEFLVDGVLKGTDTTAPYSMTLDSTTLTNASHSLTAKAYDAANNVGTSTAVAFTVSNPVSDATPPSVTASESGSSGTITLSAAATDNVAVTKVEFLVDGVLKGTDTASPFSMTLDSTTLTNASHALTAKAYDAAGNVGTSAAVAFTVSNTTSTQFNEVESNGSVAAANVVAHAMATIVGTMGNTTDKDYFKLGLAANETIKVVMSGGPSTSDYDLYLVNASDGTIVSSASGTNAETVTWTNGATAQSVYAKVISYSGSSTTQPYTLTLTYTTATPVTERVANGGFESGATAWTATSGVIDNTTSTAAHAGSWKAWLDGYGSAHTDTLVQAITIPSTAATAQLTFWLKVSSDETTTTTAYDTLKVQVRNSSGTVLATLATYSNLDKGTTWVQRSFDLSAYKGQTVQLYFLGTEGSTTATSFLVDDVSVK